MYPLQAPPAHQDQPQLGSGRPLVGITFQLSSAAAGPPSGPGQECRANWVAELSGGLVGANLGSPILCLPVSTTSSLRGSLHGQGRWGDTRGRYRQLCIHELPGPGTSLSGSTYQLDKLRQVPKAPQPQFLSPGTGSQSIRLLGCRQHSVRLCLEPGTRFSCRGGASKADDCVTATASEGAAVPPPPWTLPFAPPTLVLPDSRGLAAGPDRSDTESELKLKFNFPARPWLPQGLAGVDGVLTPVHGPLSQSIPPRLELPALCTKPRARELYLHLVKLPWGS